MAVKEEVFYEGGPHIGDLILNGLLAFTLICIPLTVAAVVRALWLRFRITDRRISVVGGWMGRDQVDLIYSEISDIIAVPRGTLKDGSKVEMRAVPKFREVIDYIESKRAGKGKVKAA
jgi:Bacterial PH domain